ncbi:MAG: M56 family metallopeptidase [Chitinophagaceae bacterium]
MLGLIPYLTRLFIAMAAVYLFYQLVLRRLTFYNWNRWYLMAYSMIAFVLPFVNIAPLMQRNNWEQKSITAWIPAVPAWQAKDVVVTTATDIAEPSSFNYMFWLGCLLAAGSCMLLTKLLIQYYSLYRIRRNASLVYNDNVRIYHVEQPIAPFSFGQSIYVNYHQHSEAELKDIIRHEFVHVQQQHSMDVLWAEILCILCWHNPFAWFIRKSIRRNLEFIADDKVLQNGVDKKYYQYLLLKVTGGAEFSIASQFNFSDLKKRIAMMNKVKSAGVHLWKFLFVLPLGVIMLVAFRQHAPVATGEETLQGGEIIKDTTPVKKYTGKEIRIESNKATVTLKDGTTETYDLSNPKEKAAYVKKYGEVPVPPVAPAPPAAPAAPAAVTAMTTPPTAPEAPVAPVAPALPKGVAGIKIRQKSNTAIVTLKDGKTETYDLNNKEQKEAYETKYGDFTPPAAPAAPTVPVSGVTPPVAPAAPAVPPAPAKTAVHYSADEVVVTNVLAIGEQPGTTVAPQRIILSGEVSITPVNYPVRVENISNSGSKFLIGKKMTAAELEHQKQYMQKKGFDVTISKADFSKGYLSMLDLSIGKDGKSKKITASDFDDLIISTFKSKEGETDFLVTNCTCNFYSKAK